MAWLGGVGEVEAYLLDLEPLAAAVIVSNVCAVGRLRQVGQAWPLVVDIFPDLAAGQSEANMSRRQGGRDGVEREATHQA